MESEGVHIEVRGTVQGVGYRPWVFQLAQRMDVRGVIRNNSRGVSIDAFGDAETLGRFVDTLLREFPPTARVRSVTATAIPFLDHTSFAIVESQASEEILISIPADLTTCDDCLGEVLDPADRRYRYPFTNCTNCGPRYSIVRESPYDRAGTSMSSFRMCDRCRLEYDSPSDRRFHAQPNACPDCGPRLVAMRTALEQITTADPIRFAARAVRAGMIAAIKGLGGFHLACDATSAQAVQRLRNRKQRDHKPLAVMVRDLAQAGELAELTGAERELLLSIERPIVLVKIRPGSPLAAPVTAGLPLVGLFLPYTPLHHLLLRDSGIPLVMTSGNRTDEPMVTSNADAFERLEGIADVYLTHDRGIVTRVDDSVARVIAGAPALIRRGRGYVPRAVEAKKAFAEPILACGAHLKNTFCIASGNDAYLGPHIGDLETVETLRAYEDAIERMKNFIGVAPLVLAHDLHPDYFSTRYALAQEGVRTIAVQHHHAHIASAMAEHGIDGPVIGVAYDGTGLGPDGTAWGGEILIADFEGFERFATLRPIPLAGGDQAIRHPWRIALALLDETYGGEAPLHSLPLFRDVAATAVEGVRRMISRGLNTTLAHGAGRWFDAFGALVLGLADANYEGEVAFRWNMVADDAERGRYPIVIREGASPWEIDPRPMVKAAVDDLMAGRSAATISARFHNTLSAATSDVVRAALMSRGAMPVVLTGGCFQNARLAESVIDALRPATRIVLNRDVPAGDGGIALGQAFIAAAKLRAACIPKVNQEVVCA
jgi:hydrogenase maturation protein HypF